MANETTEPSASNVFHLSNTAYDRLKFATQVALPGLATLYFAIASIWGLGYAEQILGTVTALVTFLGLFLTASSGIHKAEVLNTPSSTLVLDDGEAYTEFAFDPMRLNTGDEVTFTVIKPK